MILLFIATSAGIKQLGILDQRLQWNPIWNTTVPLMTITASPTWLTSDASPPQVPLRILMVQSNMCVCSLMGLTPSQVFAGLYALPFDPYLLILISSGLTSASSKVTLFKLRVSFTCKAFAGSRRFGIFLPLVSLLASLV